MACLMPGRKTGRIAASRLSAKLHPPAPPCAQNPGAWPSNNVNELTVDALGRYALYEAFPACEARRVLDRLEFQYVPKHASWLNVVESEIGALRGQYLDRRLQSEIFAWERQRNSARARIKLMFTIS